MIAGFKNSLIFNLKSIRRAPLALSVSHLALYNGVGHVALDVVQLPRGYSRVLPRRVECKEPPEDAPNHAQAPRHVEDDSPTKVRDDKATQWVGQSNAKTKT